MREKILKSYSFLPLDNVSMKTFSSIWFFLPFSVDARRDKVVAALPYEVDVSTYLGDEVLTMAEEDLLDDGKMDEVGDCHRTLLYPDLQERHNEVVGEDMNNLLEDHDAEATHRKNRNV